MMGSDYFALGMLAMAGVLMLFAFISILVNGYLDGKRDREFCEKMQPYYDTIEEMWKDYQLTDGDVDERRALYVMLKLMEWEGLKHED